MAKMRKHPARPAMIPQIIESVANVSRDNFRGFRRGDACVAQRFSRGGEGDTGAAPTRRALQTNPMPYTLPMIKNHGHHVGGLLGNGCRDDRYDSFSFL